MTDLSEPTDEFLQRPIIVLGAPRSGTTFLSHLLRHHPALAHVGEPRLTWRYGNDKKSDMLRPEDASPTIKKHIRGVFADAVSAAGKHRLLEKLPSNSLRMGFVDAVLPGCQFIHITRHGVESVLSIQEFWKNYSTGVNPSTLMRRLREIRLRQAPYYAGEFFRRLLPKRLAGLARPPVWGPHIPGIDSLVKELDVLEISCLQWRTCVEAACQYGRQLPSNRYFECRLEDMSPELLRKILAFCRLDDSPEVWSAFESMYHPESTTHRQSKAKPEELERIGRLIEPTLLWLGYLDK